MFPIRDENPTRSPAVVTIGLIAVNVLVALWQLTLSEAQTMGLFQVAGLIPARVAGLLDAPGLSPPVTLVSSQFLHGGLLHLAGNMLFLWIFGNNVEDEMGHLRFLAFYLISGIAAGAVHAATMPASTVPTVGASGAVSGVLGAYALLFPRARVHTLVILVFYVTVVPLPAMLWVGIWLLGQIIQGAATRGAQTGVAWFAHVGGFVAGALLLFLFRRRRKRSRVEPFGSLWDRG